jgi:mannan endo-1,4-beta-mannosidase
MNIKDAAVSTVERSVSSLLIGVSYFSHSNSMKFLIMRFSTICSLFMGVVTVSARVLLAPEPVEGEKLEERATGFVTRSGTGFVMDGEPFYFMGTNAYWADGLSSTDLTSLFSQMNSAGMKVLRIFAWSDNVGGAEDSSLQYWSGSTNTPNPSAFAKQIDPVVAAAEAAGIKLVVPMIGNWGASISLYIQQWLGSSATHDTFYSNANIVASYKKYVNFFVNRYKSSPAIFAWELINEPRCTGDDNRGASSACDTAMITSWVSTMSSYIKSIDSAHMVTLGDEGWFSTNAGYGDGYDYGGTIGIDWISNLELSSIDYGTIHLYPAGWGQTDAWGSTWIDQHATWAKTIGKPVVLEEFGTTSTSNRYSDVNMWMNSAYNDGYGGIQYWQFVSTFPSGYSSPDDGNGISTTESSYALIKAMAVKMNAKSGTGSSGTGSSGSGGSGSTTSAASPTTTASTGSGTVPKYGQCGGTGYTGSTTCASGSTCTYSNAYYSQCL